jgi:Uma2 family endonuclease
VPVGQSLLLDDVDWPTYSRLLRAFAERPHVRLTYDEGRLEIMSPILKHDNTSRFLLLLITTLAEELDLPLLPGGATTLRRRLRQKGAEPDECFWIANADRMEGRQRVDLRRDPPPDLAIEVDVTHSSLSRMRVFAALGVPEVWRWSKGKLTFHVRDARGAYRSVARSRSFPHVAPSDLLPFVRDAEKSGNQIPLLRRFRKWVRGRRAES